MKSLRRRASLFAAAIASAALLLPSEAGAQSTRNRSSKAHASTANRSRATHTSTANRSTAHRSPNVNRNTNRAVNSNVSRGYTGFRAGYGTPVYGGRYVPGYGVIGGGYPGSYPVFGGLYAPGFGVMGTPPTAVAGGSYIPGYGVTGGAVGAQKVAGGTYIPGYGVR